MNFFEKDILPEQLAKIQEEKNKEIKGTNRELMTRIISNQLSNYNKTCCSACMLYSFEGNLSICEDERNIVEVNFKGNKRDFFLNTESLPLNYFDYVVVEVDNGYDIGFISETEKLTRIKRKNLGLYNEPLKRIIGLASEEDLKRLKVQREEEEKSKHIFVELAKKNNLDIKLVEAEYQFDRNRITFYFVSETRVDFRQLVKDLAAVFKTRIELRQIGARDGVRKFGALASCGRELCCCTFLSDVKKISIQDIKEQRQFINPSKLNGLCGRLKCCMSFEAELYSEASLKFPELYKTIITKRGEAQVESIDIYNDVVHLYYPKTDYHEKLKLNEFEQLLNKLDY